MLLDWLAVPPPPWASLAWRGMDASGVYRAEEVQLSVTRLSDLTARQDQMLVDLKKMTAAPAPTAITTPTFVPGRVLEQQKNKPSSPSLFSANQIVGATSATPTRCSALGTAVNVPCNHIVVAFPSSGTTHLPATTTIEAGNNTLQCARDVDTDMSAEVLTHVESLSLFQEIELDSVDEVFNDIRLKDVVWEEELTDCIVTHIGGSYWFLEYVMG